MPDPTPPAMTAQDTMALLARMGDLRERVVLIGGQAVNVWVDYYLHQGRVPELAAGWPYTSKDVDFYGNRADVCAFARVLAVPPTLPTMDDATSMAGYVVYLDARGFERRVDFVPPFGMHRAKVTDESAVLEVLAATGEPTGLTFRVMNPVHCMESRVHNAVGLPHQYHTPQGLRQLRAAVSCAREFVCDVLDAPPSPGFDPARVARGLCERIFALCTRDAHGKVILLRTGIDPFEAVPTDPRLGERFLARRYPQMVSQLAATRRKVAAGLPRP